MHKLDTCKSCIYMEHARAVMLPMATRRDPWPQDVSRVKVNKSTTSDAKQLHDARATRTSYVIKFVVKFALDICTSFEY